MDEVIKLNRWEQTMARIYKTNSLNSTVIRPLRWWRKLFKFKEIVARIRIRIIQRKNKKPGP